MGDTTPDDLPSLLRKSHLHAAPYDFEHRNSEDVHHDALAAAKAEHDRIQTTARDALALCEIKAEQRYLQYMNEKEAIRVQAEQARVEEERRQREIEIAKQKVEAERRKIPDPPPRLPTPPPPPAEPSKAPPPPAEAPKAPLKSPTPPPPQQTAPIKSQSTVANPFANSTAPASAPQLPVSQPAKPPQTQTKTTPSADPKIARYVEIHKNLKQLRHSINQAGKANPDLKKKMGEMRRTLRMSLGQLTGDRTTNRNVLVKVNAILTEAFSYGSPPYDPSGIVVTKPEPIDGAINNGDTLPSLFVFLVNIFSKFVITQFINEAGIDSTRADPIGVIVASVFSKPEFLWRGRSLIDILIAKLAVVCPVLFGVRGSEKTEEGRTRLGWLKDDGTWVNEGVHNQRMTGLGAGYASICLRNFAKSKNKNSWPPTHYWEAMARITSTPPQETSPTQYTVLKAMIENYEETFLTFYGSAARAALRVALVDFPERALEPNVAVSSLTVLADKLEKDQGLRLRG